MTPGAMTNQDLHEAASPFRVIVQDLAKASVPIGGGTALQYLHIADQFLTFLTHGVGAASAIVGFWWLLYRIRRDINRPKPPSPE